SARRRIGRTRAAAQRIDQNDHRRRTRGVRQGDQAMTYPTSTLDRPFSVASERRALNPGPVGVAVAALALGALYLDAVVRWGRSVVAGAFLFGVGMQLGGGGASGTLYTAGGGNTRMLVTLLAFIAGSVIGAAHMPWWEKAPALKPISLIATFGPLAALAISLS